MNEDVDAVIDAYYAAMRRGPDAEADLVALFDPDAVYVEPFTAPDTPAVGVGQIRDRLRRGWETPLPDFELDILEIEVSTDRATTRWECRSPALPGPVRGTDSYTFRSGKITRLVVELDPPS